MHIRVFYLRQVRFLAAPIKRLINQCYTHEIASRLFLLIRASAHVERLRHRLWKMERSENEKCPLTKYHKRNR